MREGEGPPEPPLCETAAPNRPVGTVSSDADWLPIGTVRIVGGTAAAQEDLRPPMPWPATIWRVVSIFAQIYFDELRWAVGK